MASPVLQFKRGNIGAAATIPALRPGEPAFTLDKFDLFVGLDTSVAGNKFFGSHRYWKRENATNAAQLRLVDKDGTNYIAIAASDTLSGIATYRLPNTTDGTAGDYLKLISTTGGYYDLEWASIPSGTFTIAGDTGTDSFSTGDTLTFAGTANEIETAVTNNQIQFGLPDNVIVGGALTVTTGAVIDGVQIGINGANVIDTTSGKLTLNSATSTVEIAQHLDILGDLDVTGNVYIGGTTVTLRGTDVFIENKDIVLGYTTTTTPNDTTANHAGVAIASTEGTPVANFNASGINTLPSTYKQMMWFKSGTLGFSTDAFAFNYGVAIGTTTMANGVRLAVGSGITMTDTSISASNFYGTFNGNVTGSVTGIASTAIRANTVDTKATSVNTNYHLVFTDNASDTDGATMRVDAGIYYNPSSNNLFASQFIGNLVAGTIKAADTTTAMTLANSTGNVTFNGDIQIGGNDIKASDGTTALTLSATSGNVKTGGDLIAGSGYLASANGTRALYMYDTSGDVSFQGKAIVNSIRSATDSNNAISLAGRDVTLENNVKIVGVTTIGTGVGVTQFSGSVSTGTSTSSVPTSSAVINYVTSQVSAVDVTLGLNADSGGPSTVSTAQTLTINGTASEVETSVSGQTVTIGLPNDVVVGTSLSAPTIRTGTIQSSNTGATAITIAANDVTIADDLTVGGNLYVNGNTTQVNTSSITVEDRTIELGVVDGSAPSSSTTWDLGVLFNYYDGSAKKSALVWEQGNSRFKLGSVISDGGGTGNDNPQITFTTYAALEIGDLWINNSCTGGAAQVIGCVGSELQLQNITIDAGTF